MTGTTGSRPPVGLERSIATATDRVAAQLPRDRRRRPTQLTGDLTDAQPGTAQVGDLDPPLLGQEPSADLANREPVQPWHEADENTVAADLVPTRPVVARAARRGNLPSRRPDAPPTRPQLHEPLTLGRLWPPPRPLLHPTHRCQHDLQECRKCCDRRWKPPERYWPSFRGASTPANPDPQGELDSWITLHRRQLRGEGG